MSKPDLIPSVQVVEPRANPMAWDEEETASGVFLDPDPMGNTLADPLSDSLALLGTPPMQLPESPRLPEDFSPSKPLLDWLSQLRAELATVASDPTRVSSLAISGLDKLSVQAIDEILGEGEVTGFVTLDGVRYDICEAVLPGVWRVRGSDGSDAVELGSSPSMIQRAAASLRAADFPVPAPDGNTMNAPAVLTEIRGRALAWQGQPNHVLNFTLLPMSEADHDLLTGTLGRAELELNSGGFGQCRIMATRFRDIWAVQFVNAMGHTILDTVEIGGVPAAACAAQEDFEDSLERLDDMLKAYLQ